MHVRAALRNGLSPEEVAEVLLQVGVYAGVPAANRALKVARETLRQGGRVSVSDEATRSPEFVQSLERGSR